MVRIRSKLFQRIRVPLGFIFAVVAMIFARPTPLLIATGVSIGLVGVAIRAWSSGHIQKNKALAFSGPYAFTRNPLYLGSAIMGIGLTIATGVWWLTLLFVALFLGIYFPVMSVEADELTEIFGEDYKRYSKAVPLFFPWRRRGFETNQKFEMDLYMRYREYRVLVGFAAIVVVLIFKAYLYN